MIAYRMTTTDGVNYVPGYADGNKKVKQEDESNAQLIDCDDNEVEELD